jgi:hypothetical protein
MTLIILTDEERTRFRLWLKQEQNHCDAFIRQVENIPGCEMMFPKFKSERAACEIVDKMLDVEIQTI